MSDTDAKALDALGRIHEFIRTHRHAVLLSPISRNPSYDTTSSFYRQAFKHATDLRHIIRQYKNSSNITRNLDNQNIWKAPREQRHSKKQSAASLALKDDIRTSSETVLNQLKDLIDLCNKPRWGDVVELTDQFGKSAAATKEAYSLVQAMNREAPEISSSVPSAGAQDYLNAIVIFLMFIVGSKE